MNERQWFNRQLVHLKQAPMYSSQTQQLSWIHAAGVGHIDGKGKHRVGSYVPLHARQQLLLMNWYKTSFDRGAPVRKFNQIKDYYNTGDIDQIRHRLRREGSADYTVISVESAMPDSWTKLKARGLIELISDYKYDSNTNLYVAAQNKPTDDYERGISHSISANREHLMAERRWQDSGLLVRTIPASVDDDDKHRKTMRLKSYNVEATNYKSSAVRHEAVSIAMFDQYVTLGN